MKGMRGRTYTNAAYFNIEAVVKTTIIRFLGTEYVLSSRSVGPLLILCTPDPKWISGRYHA